MLISQERERMVEASRDGSMEVASELWAEPIRHLSKLQRIPCVIGEIDRVQKIF